MTGLSFDTSFNLYRAWEGISASDLKRLSKSPMAYRHYKDHPQTPTSSMDLGTAVHVLILEPQQATERIAVWCEGVRRGKAWDAFKEQSAGKLILTQDEWDTAMGMAKSVLDHAPAMKYLEQGRSEVSMQWSHGGRLFKGRIDWLTGWDAVPVIVDLKTTRDASPRKFGADAYRLGYHIQFALYADGYHAITGIHPRVICIAVESRAPYEPAVFEVPADALDRGREEYDDLIETLQRCEKSGIWPPACESEQLLQLPAWAFEAEDTDLSDLGLAS